MSIARNVTVPHKADANAMKMVSICLFIMLANAPYAHSQPSYVAGSSTVSCSVYSEWRTNANRDVLDRHRALSSYEWVLGFIIGALHTLSSDIKVSLPTYAEGQLWLDTYCRNNRSKNMNNAAAAFLVSLTRVSP
jgi:hypothetical protein